VGLTEGMFYQKLKLKSFLKSLDAEENVNKEDIGEEDVKLSSSLKEKSLQNKEITLR
jgi:hypothetical protein